MDILKEFGAVISEFLKKPYAYLAICFFCLLALTEQLYHFLNIPVPTSVQRMWLFYALLGAVSVVLSQLVVFVYSSCQLQISKGNRRNKIVQELQDLDDEERQLLQGCKNNSARVVSGLAVDPLLLGLLGRGILESRTTIGDGDNYPFTISDTAWEIIKKEW